MSPNGKPVKYWKLVHAQAWQETKSWARSHAELTMIGTVIAVLGIVALWFWGRNDGSIDELIVKLMGAFVIVACGLWLYWKKLAEIPARWHNENLTIIEALRAENTLLKAGDGIKYGLSAVAKVDLTSEEVPKKLELVITLHNSLTETLRYGDVKLAWSLDGGPEQAKRGASDVIYPGKDLHFRLPLPHPYEGRDGLMKCLIVLDYGRPDGPATRRYTREMTVPFQPRGVVVNYTCSGSGSDVAIKDGN